MTIDTGLASGPGGLEASSELRSQWRTLTLAATATAIVTSPVAYLWFHRQLGWSWHWALLATVGAVAAFRGVVEVGLRRVIPWPSLFGVDDRRLKEEDVLARRRAWFWSRVARTTVIVAAPRQRRLRRAARSGRLGHLARHRWCALARPLGRRRLPHGLD